MPKRQLKVAFIHPDLGIGGAERLVVDAALGLQQLGHSIDLYTSYHDPGHCFEETRDGTLSVHHIQPPFPRSLKGKFHILFAHLRQLHLTLHLLSKKRELYDVYFVDQLATCVPFLRLLGQTRVVFYCHFPDKLLANGAFVEGELFKKNASLMKRLYRIPMDWLEEVTTRQADVILANSLFTARVFKSYFPSIKRLPRVVYPGINLAAYEPQVKSNTPDVHAVASPLPTLLSLNRFEGKKNISLALQAFSLLIKKQENLRNLRLVLAGGYDPRLEDNVRTLETLVSTTTALSLTYNIISPLPIPPSASELLPSKAEEDPQVLFLLNFTTVQRSALLQSPTTLVLLYTPVNEHFGIVPIEAMACGLPVLACDSGGPTESIISSPPHLPSERTGWLKESIPEVWAEALVEIVSLPNSDPIGRKVLNERAIRRAREIFGMEAMAKGLEDALREAKAMGKVDIVWLETVPTVFVVILGFLIAYIVGPFVIPQ